MSAPRPFEADVEDERQRLGRKLMQDHGCIHHQGPNPFLNPCRACMRRVDLILASDWLIDHDAARDAEHERKVAALRAQIAVSDDGVAMYEGAVLEVDEQTARAEAAERALADLRDVATNKVVHDYRGGLCPDQIEGHDSRDPECPACRIIAAADALLSRDDAAGAGGAG